MSYNHAIIECMRSGENLVDAVRSGSWIRREFPVRAATDGPAVAPAPGDDPGSPYGGHAVLLVGYDEYGFLAKNSWGESWGDGGYGRINYDYHRLYALGGALIEGARVRAYPHGSSKNREALLAGKFHLKVQPRGHGDDAAWQLSTWQLAPLEANTELVEYQVQAMGADGRWTVVRYEVVDAGGLDHRQGAPLTISGWELRALLQAQQVFVSARFGFRDVNNPSVVCHVRPSGLLTYGPFQPTIHQATDFPPREQ
jgi:hypothetical protein